ncbi:hypothetical protein ANCCAN_08508 [Ancylostoma caninum]|uniref:Uncharacterized protein n=1 Tax=Ancylostoma caninum TaxID=29170 RepID=A0A368GPF9_ANCCA|nr:hypothetical protein ANCCAN_08508 [Ancylostoma caninum]
MFLEIEPAPHSTGIIAGNETHEADTSVLTILVSETHHQPVSRDGIYWTLFSINLLLIMLSFAFNLFMTIIFAQSIPKIRCVSE